MNKIDVFYGPTFAKDYYKGAAFFEVMPRRGEIVAYSGIAGRVDDVLHRPSNQPETSVSSVRLVPANQFVD